MRVQAARSRQIERQGSSNADLNPAGIERYCTPNAEALAELESAMQHLKLSARGYQRILKVARTIADLKGAAQIDQHHVNEALTLRSSEWQRCSPLPAGDRYPEPA
jgi:magnesium chelatase family protein